MTYTIGSLFAGIGGLDLAAQWAGFETAWFVEKEPFPQQVLQKHWPDVPLYDDVFECHDLPYVDVIVGGFPCQPFSVAGKRQGADDERFLLPEMLRIIREVQPYAVLFENVPGFPSLNDGTEFKYLLRALAEMGFDAEWGHLRASDCGAPHQRERWFCVAYAVINGNGNGRDGEALYNRKRNYSQNECGRNFKQYGFITHGQSLGNANGRRRGQCYTGKRAIPQFNAGCGKRLASSNRFGRKHTSQRYHALSVYRFAASRNGAVRATQSFLGRTSHGLSSGLDFIGWPARPGELQHDYEPPRVTSGRTPNRAARLKALGNAVVPEVVYPLFVAIREWLEKQTVEAAA